MQVNRRIMYVGKKRNESNPNLFFSFDFKAVDWWLEDMYLANPLSLPINSNPAFVLPQQQFTNTEDYLK